MAIDPREVREMLVEAARAAETLTYGEVIARLGNEFNTNLVGQLGKVLDRIDYHAKANGEPPLAVLVVRKSDGLPGQGWWIGRAKAAGYGGDWVGEEALAHVTELQEQAFEFWAEQ